MRQPVTGGDVRPLTAMPVVRDRAGREPTAAQRILVRYSRDANTTPHRFPTCGGNAPRDQCGAIVGSSVFFYRVSVHPAAELLVVQMEAEAARSEAEEALRRWRSEGEGGGEGEGEGEAEGEGGSHHRWTFSELYVQLMPCF